MFFGGYKGMVFGFLQQRFAGVFGGCFCVAQGVLCRFLCFRFCGFCLEVWTLRSLGLVFQAFFGVFFWIGVILFTESFSLSAVKVLYGLACFRAV